MNIKQRTAAFIWILLPLWLTLFVACSGDNPAADKINNPPIPPYVPPPTTYAKVTATELKVEQPNWTGKCPHAFQLTGTITTSGPGAVVYQFRDDDAMWTQGGTLEFKSAETKTVTMTTYSFSISTEYYFGLELFGPKLPADWVLVKTTCE
jgi:hypothetical protein